MLRQRRPAPARRSFRLDALAAGIGLIQLPAWALSPPVAASAPADPSQVPAPALLPRETTLQTVHVRAQAAAARDDVLADTTRVARGDQAIRDVPQSVTVVNRAVMDAQGAASLTDALRNVPGITLGGAEGGQIGNNINLRGFTARTDVYLDGVRDRGQYYRDVFFLESVDVLKGPASMLYGRGSTGGVIDQVSRQPGPEAAGEASLALDSNGGARTTLDVNRPLSPTSAFRLDAMAQDARGTRDTLRNRDIGLAPSLRAGIGTDTEVTLSALLLHNHDMPDYGLPSVNGRPAAVSTDNDYGLTDDRTVQDVATFAARVSHRVSPTTTLRSVTQAARYRTDAREVGASRVGSFVDGTFTALATSASGNTTDLPLDQLYVLLGSHDRVVDDHGLYHQTEVSTRFDTGGLRHALLAGIDLSHDEYANQASARTNPAIAGATGVAVVALVDPARLETPDGVVTTPGNLVRAQATGVGAYVNDTVELGGGWKLVAGVRRDRYAASLTNSINAGNTPGSSALPRAAQVVGSTSVRAGVLYQPDESQSWYASYGTSFDPSLETLTVTTGQQSLAPERTRSFELGGKLGLLHGDLSLDAAVFRIEKQDARSQVSAGVWTLDGNVRVDGVELATAGRLTRTWQVIAGWTMLDGRVTKASALDGTQGKVLANTPRHSATLWTTWNATPQWELGGGATAMSARWASNTDVVRVPGYVRLDATLAWHQPRYDLRLNVLNLADTNWIASVQASDGGRSVPGLGRTAQLTGTWHF